MKLACKLSSGFHVGTFPLKMDKTLGSHLAKNTPYLGAVELATIQPANKMPFILVVKRSKPCEPKLMISKML